MPAFPLTGVWARQSRALKIIHMMVQETSCLKLLRFRDAAGIGCWLSCTLGVWKHYQ